jgi:DNA-binding NtrC family response regulator
MARVVDRIQAVIAGLRGLFGPRRRPARTGAGTALQALAVMGEGPGREALQVVFRDAMWRLAVADSAEQAIVRQQQEPLPIILYERELPERDWRQAVSSFSRLTPRPCVILLSRGYDQNLWDELVRCGGFDLLRIPIDRNAVIQTVSAGWAIWRRRTAPEWNQAITPLRTA